MKRIWKELFFAVICMMMFSVAANASTADNAKKAYANMLSKSGGGDSFLLLDINNDSVPEMFVNYYNRREYELYAYTGSNVKSVGNYFYKTVIKIYPSRSILMTSLIGGSARPYHRFYFDYYYFKSDLKPVFSQTDYFEQNVKYYYDGNHKSIDSETYNNLINKWLGNPLPPATEIGWADNDSHQWIINTDSNRKKYLSVLPAPGKTQITNICPGKDCFLVKWKKAANATRYQVYRKIGNDKYKRLATVDASTLSYTDKTAASTDGRVYTYAVRACNGSKPGSFAYRSYYRLSPKAISKWNSSGSKISISWKRNSAATGYKIKYSTDPGFKNAKVRYIKKSKTTSTNLTGLKKGTRYYIKMCCYYSKGGKLYYSAFCNPVSIVCSSGKSQSSVTPQVSITTGTTGNGTIQISASSNVGTAVSWKSSDESVAVVSDGKVAARGAGSAVITASVSYEGIVYSASCTVTVGVQKSYGAWSAWKTGTVSDSSNLEVERTALYRYYCFACPVCGGREPFQGMSDCHQYTLSEANAQTAWFPTPYSACKSQGYSYTTAKRYTESLGDGKRWNFSTGNLNDTAIGTLDAAGPSAAVITSGYRTRSVSTSYYISKII